MQSISSKLRTLKDRRGNKSYPAQFSIFSCYNNLEAFAVHALLMMKLEQLSWQEDRFHKKTIADKWVNSSCNPLGLTARQTMDLTYNQLSEIAFLLDSWSLIS